MCPRVGVGAASLQKKFEEARRLNDRVLEIRAEAFGEEHLCYAHALNTRATLVYEKVRFEGIKASVVI